MDLDKRIFWVSNSSVSIVFGMMLIHYLLCWDRKDIVFYWPSPFIPPASSLNKTFSALNRLISIIYPRFHHQIHLALLCTYFHLFPTHHSRIQTVFPSDLHIFQPGVRHNNVHNVVTSYIGQIRHIGRLFCGIPVFSLQGWLLSFLLPAAFIPHLTPLWPICL